MKADAIARAAIKDTEQAAAYVTPEVRCKLAIAFVAITIDGMDESIASDVRMARLSDSIAAVRAMLAAPAAQ